MLWILIASLTVTRLSLTNPAFAFPISDGAWFWIFSRTPGFWDGESADDLVFVVHLLIAFMIVGVATIAGRSIWRALRTAS